MHLKYYAKIMGMFRVLNTFRTVKRSKFLFGARRKRCMACMATGSGYYTVSHKKRATLFSIITSAFSSLIFVHFIPVMAWWPNTCITLHVTNVYSMQSRYLLKLNTLGLKIGLKFIKTCKNAKAFLAEELSKNFLSRIGRDEHWTTFSERCK